MAVSRLTIERRRDQPWPPFDFAAWMARQTRSGVVGIPMSVTPSGDSASITALTTCRTDPSVFVFSTLLCCPPLDLDAAKDHRDGPLIDAYAPGDIGVIHALRQQREHLHLDPGEGG
jgi:hypothetical protein